MPIKISNHLPAAKILESENIFVMTEERATHQDIRPLQILILNLMPTKIETETQLLRLLGNSPLQLDIDLLQTVTHISKNTSREHLLEFYQTFADVQKNKYDGMIITGAPVESLDFTQVDYWDELCEIMDWSVTNVYSTLHICWGAQAGLYHHHHIPKYPLPQKLSGIFRHRLIDPQHPLTRGFDEMFYIPIPVTPRFTRTILTKKSPSSFWPCLKQPARRLSPPRMPGRSLSPVTANMTATPWPMNISGIWPEAFILPSRRIISPAMIPTPCRRWYGAATPTCFLPIGSITSSISKPPTTSPPSPEAGTPYKGLVQTFAPAPFAATLISFYDKPRSSFRYI